MKDYIRFHPVYTKETRALNRSMKFISILIVYNITLLIAGIVSIAGGTGLGIIKLGFGGKNAIVYYITVTIVQAVIISLLVPAITAEHISGEKERQTLDILFLTRLSEKDIVFGKFLSSCSVISIIIITGLPVLFVSLVWGGVRIGDIIQVNICMMCMAVHFAGATMWISSLSKGIPISFACSYIYVVFQIVGTYAVKMAVSYIYASVAETYYALSVFLNIIDALITFTNPFILFFGITNLQTGNGALYEDIVLPFSDVDFLKNTYPALGLLWQVALGLFFTFLSCAVLKNKYKKKNKNNHGGYKT